MKPFDDTRSSTTDDRVLPLTRIISILIIPFLVAAFIVPAIWLINRRMDTGAPDERDAVLPAAVRWAIVAVGAAAIATALALMFAPNALISIWPSMLTPLTARVGAAWFALFAFASIGFAWERRWSAAKVLFQALAFAVILNIIAVTRAWDDFDKGNPLTWAFVGGLAALLVGVGALYWTLEQISRGRKPSAAS